tara:strand:+ start:648 stop:2009 length:1362 start_codon:yes stop_codon:yes gene_type:complete
MRLDTAFILSTYIFSLAVAVSRKEQVADLLKKIPQAKQLDFAKNYYSIFHPGSDFESLIVQPNKNHKETSFDKYDFVDFKGTTQFVLPFSMDTINEIDFEDRDFFEDATNSNGDSVLHLAVKEKNIDVIFGLIQQDYNLWRQNSAGETPISLLFLSKNKHFIDLFFDRLHELADNLNSNALLALGVIYSTHDHFSKETYEKGFNYLQQYIETFVSFSYLQEYFFKEFENEDINKTNINHQDHSSIHDQSTLSNVIMVFALAIAYKLFCFFKDVKYSSSFKVQPRIHKQVQQSEAKNQNNITPEEEAQKELVELQNELFKNLQKEEKIRKQQEEKDAKKKQLLEYRQQCISSLNDKQDDILIVLERLNQELSKLVEPRYISYYEWKHPEKGSDLYKLQSQPSCPGLKDFNKTLEMEFKEKKAPLENDIRILNSDNQDNPEKKIETLIKYSSKLS